MEWMWQQLPYFYVPSENQKTTKQAEVYEKRKTKEDNHNVSIIEYLAYSWYWNGELMIGGCFGVKRVERDSRGDRAVARPQCTGARPVWGAIRLGFGPRTVACVETRGCMLITGANPRVTRASARTYEGTSRAHGPCDGAFRGA
ncbi:hypothetical protein PIB30_039022 [Stylosanthes scabra]|uniref:Uncharacterized protein n=1 Tax=Stylosanthes scabra TaxID=79078 RepID=A0ABU6REE8_9FABA|nr:hypothetical protein [Stylosanthes scabra]